MPNPLKNQITNSQNRDSQIISQPIFQTFLKGFLTFATPPLKGLLRCPTPYNIPTHSRHHTPFGQHTLQI